MLKEFLVFLPILAVLAVGTMSPGPSFLMVARTAVAKSRNEGLAASLGMGIGGLVFALMALLGLHSLLTAVPALYVAIKIVGGLYLLYLAVQIWRGASVPLADTEAVTGNKGSFLRAFRLGLATQLSNPKTALYYASVFAALLPSYIDLGLLIILAVVIFSMETSWYAVVTLVLSSSAPRRAYLRCKSWIDRTASLLIGFIASKLLFDAVHT